MPDSRIYLMKIFSGESNKPLAQKIAKELGINLSDIEIHVFPDEEKRIRVLDDVVGQDCVIVQSTSLNPDKNYMELFFITDALKRSGAKSITAVIPYLGYQRQDHVFRTGEAVSLEVIIETLEAVGINRIITFDLHSIRIADSFNIPTKELSALSVFAEKIKENNWNDNDTVLVSPDLGGRRRIQAISGMLEDMPYALIEKNRDLSTGNVTANEIEGKILPRAIIVDDMISSGKTILTAVKLLKRNGAKDVFVFATHPVFSQNSEKILQESGADKIFVTDTVDVPEKKRFSNLEILSVAKEIARELKTVIQ
jgi:ribose-phosphate pyrophosphokinase